MGFLDEAGLSRVWTKIENKLNEKQNTITAGNGLSKDSDTLNVTNPNKGILTQIEFDALTEEQKANGTYFIDDGIGGSAGSSNNGSGVPVGTIVIWSGTSEDIPSGWAFCDGQDGRPDLRDKFVLGAGTTHAVGDSGGEETCTLTVEEMPEHSHVFGMTVDPKKVQESGSFFNASLMYNTKDDTVISKTGGSQPHNNMPPYYALCYIIKTEEDSGSGGGAGGESAGEIYSTEETRIGTWVDGKPLYRKTIYSTIPDIVDDFTLVPGAGGLYIDQLVNAFGHVDTKDKSGQIAIPNAYFLLKSTPGGINFMSESSNQVGTTIMFTIEYTKTTD